MIKYKTLEPVDSEEEILTMVGVVADEDAQVDEDEEDDGEPEQDSEQPQASVEPESVVSQAAV